VLIVPPPVPKEIPLLEFNVNVAVVCNVPLFKAN